MTKTDLKSLFQDEDWLMVYSSWWCTHTYRCTRPSRATQIILPTAYSIIADLAVTRHTSSRVCSLGVGHDYPWPQQHGMRINGSASAHARNTPIRSTSPMVHWSIHGPCVHPISHLDLPVVQVLTATQPRPYHTIDDSPLHSHTITPKQTIASPTITSPAIACPFVMGRPECRI